LIFKEEKEMYTAIVFFSYACIAIFSVFLLTKCELIQILMWHVLNRLTLRDEEKLTYEEYKRVFKDEQRAIKKYNTKKRGKEIIHDERRKKNAKRYSNGIEWKKYADRK